VVGIWGITSKSKRLNLYFWYSCETWSNWTEFIAEGCITMHVLSWAKVDEGCVTNWETIDLPWILTPLWMPDILNDSRPYSTLLDIGLTPEPKWSASLWTILVVLVLPSLRCLAIGVTYSTTVESFWGGWAVVLFFFVMMISWFPRLSTITFFFEPLRVISLKQDWVIERGYKTLSCSSHSVV